MRPAPALRAALLASLASLGGTAEAQMSGQPVRLVTFDTLDGWADDDHAAALAVFRETCRLMDGDDWQALCAVAAHEVGPGEARGFFEMFFRPVLAGDPDEALFTGYFEPELPGSLEPTPRYTVPIYRPPPDLPDGRAWATRAEIEQEGLLAGRGLEIAWLADPVDKFFLQIQGSGRIRLEGGGLLRVGYGGKNGHGYRSVGREMVRRGLLGQHEVSADRIRAWVRANPDEGRELLHHNPSYVFFREVTEVAPDEGPLGAMLRPLTAGRSIAVDPGHVPLGAPVWLEKDGRDTLRRLMVAQDTGSAIRGAQRADIFYGTGAAAGRAAGAIRDPGRLVVLLPIERAWALAPGG